MEAFWVFIDWVAPPIIILVAAVAGKRETVAYQNAIVSIVFIWISLLAALRYQTGGDWDGYESYFDAVDIYANIYEGYLGSSHMLQYEPGYYVISYIVKSLGLSYLAVNVLSIFVFAFALYRFVCKEYLPLYFVSLIFIGLPHITLYYNQVRQALALGFVLMAVQSSTKKSFFALGILALSFQVTSVVFLICGVIAWFKAGFFEKLIRVGLVCIPIAIFLVRVTNIAAYDLLRIFLPENFQFKIDLYQEEDTGFGAFRFLTILYIVYCTVFLFAKYQLMRDIKVSQEYIIKLTLLCSLLVPYSVILFPNAYPFFNRSLVFSMILFSMSGSVLHKYSLGNRGPKLILIPFYGLGLLSMVYYFVTLYTYESVYIPYKSFIFP